MLCFVPRIIHTPGLLYHPLITLLVPHHHRVHTLDPPRFFELLLHFTPDDVAIWRILLLVHVIGYDTLDPSFLELLRFT